MALSSGSFNILPNVNPNMTTGGLRLNQSKLISPTNSSNKIVAPNAPNSPNSSNASI